MLYVDSMDIYEDLMIEKCAHATYAAMRLL